MSGVSGDNDRLEAGRLSATRPRHSGDNHREPTRLVGSLHDHVLLRRRRAQKTQYAEKNFLRSWRGLIEALEQTWQLRLW